MAISSISEREKLGSPTVATTRSFVQREKFIPSMLSFKKTNNKKQLLTCIRISTYPKPPSSMCSTA